MLPYSPPPTLSVSDGLIRDIAQEAHCPNNEGRIRSHLTTVFRVIRYRASFEQSLAFLEVLPTPFKAIFLDNWHIVPHAPATINSLDEWADEVVRHEQSYPLRDRTKAQDMIRAIFGVLSNRVGHEVLRDRLDFLAPEVRVQLVEQPAPYQYADTCIWLS